VARKSKYSGCRVSHAANIGQDQGLLMIGDELIDHKKGISPVGLVVDAPLVMLRAAEDDVHNVIIEPSRSVDTTDEPFVISELKAI